MANAMDSTLLEAVNLTKSFNGTRVLDAVSFSVAAGEIVGVWGRNASGKTTLAHILCGEVQPDAGELRLLGEPVRLRGLAQGKKRGISAIFGDVELVESLSVAENLLMGNMRSIGFGPGRGLVRHTHIRKTARELCDQYGLDVDVGEAVRTLSLPERQQIGLLKAVIQSPRLLIVDDAFSALGGGDLACAFTVLRRLAADGAGVVFFSHNYRQLLAVCSDVMKIEDGKLSAKVSPAEFVGTLPNTEKSLRTIPKLHLAKKQVLFSCRNLCYRQIIRHVSCDLRPGEVLGILGASNSGRSTMARLLYGDLPRSLGKILLDGRPVDIQSPGSALKHRIALMLDDSKRFSLLENADLTHNINLTRYSDRLRPVKLVVSSRRERDDAKKVADRLGIRRDTMQQRAGELSASSQKMVILGRWLSAGCQVFLLDEPTQRLDAPGKLQIYNVINELSRQGKGVILFTSDINEALGICDRVLTLLDGEINGDFPAAKASHDALSDKIYPQ